MKHRTVYITPGKLIECNRPAIEYLNTWFHISPEVADQLCFNRFHIHSLYKITDIVCVHNNSKVANFYATCLYLHDPVMRLHSNLVINENLFKLATKILDPAEIVLLDLKYMEYLI